MKSRLTPFAFRFAVGCIAAAALHPGAQPAGAGTPAAQAQTGRAPVPAHQLYYFFFEHIARQQEAGAEADRAGLSGNAIRGYYRKRIGLSGSEESALRGIALACREALRKQDQAAKVLIESFRARVATSQSRQGEPVPSPPKELEALQAQRDKIILNHVEQLRTAMSAAAFLKVDTFVRNQFAANVTSRPAREAIRDRPREGAVRR